MSDKPETIFVEGMYFSKPHENAPEFIKGRISVKIAEFLAFAQKYEKNNGYIDIDLKKSKEGKLYLQLNTFTPKAKADNDVPVIDLS